MNLTFFSVRSIVFCERKRQNRLKNKYLGEVKEKYLENSIDESLKKCRICLKYGCIPIYADNDSFNVPEAIRSFGDIEISENDNFPKYLCKSCHSWLKSAVLFRKSAKESDEILRQSSDQNVDHYSDCDGYEDNIQDIDKSNVVVKLYRCKICNLKFSSLDQYISHKNSRQHRNVRVQCPVCHGILTAQLYKKHLARHQSASHLICDICGKLYRKDNLARHLQLHNYELPHLCQVCPYRGRFLESLKIHMRTHTGQKPFSCDKCELRFLTRSNLNRHLLTHRKEKPHKCIECGRGFYTKRDLDVHFKSDHVGVKDFGCRFCGNKYATRKALMRHELRVHKRDKMAKGRMPLYLQEEYRKNIDFN